MRIVEASIAILIVLTVLFYLYMRSQEPIESRLDETARGVLEEIALNASIRKIVLEEDEQLLNQTVRSYVPAYLSYEIRICQVDRSCGKSSYSGEDVYAAERVIGADVQTSSYGPKKVRLFIWNAYAN